MATVHDEILSLIDSKDIEPGIISHMKALEPNHQVSAKADLKFEKIRQSQIPSSSTAGVSSSAGVNSNGIPAQCRLPKLTLPEFTGEPLDWQGFWDQYQVSIHNNHRISDIDKFSYLKCCAKVEPMPPYQG